MCVREPSSFGKTPSATLQPKRYLARGSLNLMYAAVGPRDPQIIIKEIQGPSMSGVRDKLPTLRHEGPRIFFSL